MKRKFTAILLFIAVYCVLITVYFLMQPACHTPPELQGTAADPRTFMSDSEILKIHQYATIRYLAYFLSSPYQWLLLLILFLSGFADRIRQKVSGRFRGFFSADGRICRDPVSHPYFAQPAGRYPAVCPEA